MDKIVWLEDRGVVEVAGEDAAAFLQGLVTNDVETLARGEARYAALLTPQGKILFDFLVLRRSEDFLLDCPRDQAAALVKRLGLYRLRSKVSIADLSADTAVLAYFGGAAPAAGEGVYADPRAALGWREIAPRAGAAPPSGEDLAAYDALRIANGVPAGGLDFAYGDAFPHDADMDLLNGIDFAKGCYVGQEVVSRMKHRAAIRKRIERVALEGAAPPPGSPVMDGELAVGALGGVRDGLGLALLRLDRVEEAEAAGRPLRAGAAMVTRAAALQPREP